MSTSSSTSPAASQPGMLDPLVESMLDLSDYDGMSYQSPALSPETTKANFARPSTTTATANSVLPAPQPLNGPSHQYDLYKQQTGIVPGALANTFAVNQNNTQITGYNGFSMDYLGLGASDDVYDFNTSPAQTSMDDIDVDFASPAGDASFFFSDATVNPSAIGGQESQSLPSPPVVPTQTSNVGRLWPGMHQQAALAKAQAQQRQQQQIIQQQQQPRQAMQVQAKQQQQQRAKNAQPTNPLVEQKISQLLNSMRAKPASPDSIHGNGGSMSQLPRLKKDEDDMDEDERLLASEEGKKLSSKERRQLRNKVSARAFRSRRKEYITQLEAEIANKVTENGDLRAQNRALLEENKRLTDLTRMLLSSPSFSDFLDRLSSNPNALPQTQPAPQVEQRQESRQVPKDVNPYGSRHQAQQIGMALIPEQTMDFSMLSIETDASFNYQPQVYAVLETPEVPVQAIDISTLSGKTSNFVGETSYGSDEESKMDLPRLPTFENKDKPAVAEEKVVAPEAPAVVIDDEFEHDPEYALYHSTSTSTVKSEETLPVQLDTDGLATQHAEIFGGIEPEKALARYQLVDASEEEATAALAMARVQRLSESLEAVRARLETLTVDL